MNDDEIIMDKFDWNEPLDDGFELDIKCCKEIIQIARKDERAKAKEEVLNEVLGIISVFLTVEIQESRYYGQGESKEYQLLFELKNAIKTLSQNHSSSESKNFNVSPDDKELPSPQTKPNLTELNSLCRDGVDKTEDFPKGEEEKT